MDTKIALQKLINTNLDLIITEVLPSIENDLIRLSAIEVVQRLKATVVALTDDIEPNKEQILAIWGTLTSDQKVVDAVKLSLNQAISKVDDANLRDGLTLLVEPVLKTLIAVSDNTKPDGEQIKKIWKDFLDSPVFIAFVLSNISWVISKVIKDERIREWILNLIKLFSK